MAPSKLSNQVSGKTVRLSWIDGPTKGTTQEHVFHQDGAVVWRSIGKDGKKAETEIGDAQAAQKTR